MIAGRALKQLISHTKEAARSFRESLDELAQGLIHPEAPQPALARVPVRNRLPQQPPFGKQIRRQGGHQFNRFGFNRSTALFTYEPVRFASTYVKPQNSLFRSSVFRQGWFAQPLKQLSSINGNTISRGVFPSTLYANFVNAGKQGSRQHQQRVTRECVKSLNQMVRAFVLQTKEELADKKMVMRGGNYGLTYSSVYAAQVLEMARTNSRFVNEMELRQCFVDFKISNFASTIPSMTFIDEDIMADLAMDVAQMEEQVKEVIGQINLVRTEFGALPISRHSEESGETVIRVHFPNCDLEKVETLLRDIGVTRGVIHEVTTSTDATEDAATAAAVAAATSVDVEVASPMFTSATPTGTEIDSMILSTSVSSNDIDATPFNDMLSASDFDVKSDNSDLATVDFFPDARFVSSSDSVYIVDENNFV